ncbi:hydroxylase accessory protein YqeC [Spirochaetia bacterium]|nr:hydroxylase accessory protein YqeC [Spirochaetia bacterium]
MTLTEYFAGLGRQVYSIIGCGGKTSLVWVLAQSNRNKKVLVTTTTHIQNPSSASGKYDFLISDDTLPKQPQEIKTGITFAVHIDDVSGHSGSLPLEALEKIIPFFDYVYIEADGSRSRPLKAWEHYEPVITKSTTVTIGILPLNTIGKIVNNETVHRLPLFTQLTGAQETETIKHEHIYSVITGNNFFNNQKHKGLFDAAVGKKILFFNKSDAEKNIYDTYPNKIISMINNFDQDLCYSILCGSIINNTVSMLKGTM